MLCLRIANDPNTGVVRTYYFNIHCVTWQYYKCVRYCTSLSSGNNEHVRLKFDLYFYVDKRILFAIRALIVCESQQCNAFSSKLYCDALDNSKAFDGIYVVYAYMHNTPRFVSRFDFCTTQFRVLTELWPLSKIVQKGRHCLSGSTRNWFKWSKFNIKFNIAWI